MTKGNNLTIASLDNDITYPPWFCCCHDKSKACLVRVRKAVTIKYIQQHVAHFPDKVDLYIESMKKFIGCLLHTEPLSKTTFLSKYCLLCPVNRHPFVRADFSLNRFSNPLNYLRFDDKTARSARYERGVLDVCCRSTVYFVQSIVILLYGQIFH